MHTNSIDIVTYVKITEYRDEIIMQYVSELL